MAKLYRIDPQTDRLQDVSFPHVDGQPAFEAGGGGLISTADDYLKFARMMLGQGEVDGVRLVKASTLEMMTQNRLTEAQLIETAAEPYSPVRRTHAAGDH